MFCSVGCLRLQTGSSLMRSPTFMYDQDFSICLFCPSIFSQIPDVCWLLLPKGPKHYSDLVFGTTRTSMILDLMI